MLQPPMAGLRDAHQILLSVLMDVPILVRKGTSVEGCSKEENTPHRKIDAVVSPLCVTKAVMDYAVVESRSNVRYVQLWSINFSSNVYGVSEKREVLVLRNTPILRLRPSSPILIGCSVSIHS